MTVAKNGIAKQTTNEWYSQVDRTSETDDERIHGINILPPPEHLIRFFPIAGSAVEKLIAKTRLNVREILNGNDDRLLVVMGP